MSAVEKLRRIWTPGREVEEVIANLDPQSELDSTVRDYLHRVVQQTGPKKLLLERQSQPVLNTGTLRWEVVHFVAPDGSASHREVNLWIE